MAVHTHRSHRLSITPQGGPRRRDTFDPATDHYRTGLEASAADPGLQGTGELTSAQHVEHSVELMTNSSACLLGSKWPSQLRISPGRANSIVKEEPTTPDAKLQKSGKPIYNSCFGAAVVKRKPPNQ